MLIRKRFTSSAKPTRSGPATSMIPFTGGLDRVVHGDDMGDDRRDTLLTELHQRVRDFAEGPDGLIYVLTDGNENAVLRIEPTAL